MESLLLISRNRYCREAAGQCYQLQKCPYIWLQTVKSFKVLKRKFDHSPNLEHRHISLCMMLKIKPLTAHFYFDFIIKINHSPTWAFFSLRPLLVKRFLNIDKTNKKLKKSHHSISRMVSKNDSEALPLLKLQWFRRSRIFQLRKVSIMAV